MLIVLSGQPGTGKTTIARALARRLSAAHICVDTMEAVLARGEPARASVGDAGYVLGYAIAGDQLRVGRTVVADSVNPLPLTRDAWQAVGARAGVPVLEVEVVCSDVGTHRRRVETREPHPAARMPTWQDVVEREYESWGRAPLVVDTAGRDVEASVGQILRGAAKAAGRAAYAAAVDLRATAAAAIRNDRSEVLLLRRRDDGSWCLPGGHLEPGETWSEAALRECREELGWQVELDHLLGVYSDPAAQTHEYPDGTRFHFVGVVFEGRLLNQVGPPDGEGSEWAFFGPDALPERIMRGDRPPIADAFSTAPRPFIR